MMKLIETSKRPLIILGGGARSQTCVELIYSLKYKIKVPFLLTHHSLDILSFDDEHNLGFPGIFGNRFANMIVQSSDLIIAIGTRLGLSQTGYNKYDFGRNAKIIVVDIDDSELVNDNIKISLSINEKSEVILDLLNKNSKLFRDVDRYWLHRANEIKKRYSSKNESHSLDSNFVNSYEFIDWLSNNLNHKINYCTDMGLSYQSTYQAIKLKNNSRLITNTNFAPMGWGVCASIGICMGSEKINTILLTGDGGLMMNLQELATIAYHNLPIKVTIYNNKGYLTMKQSQILSFNGRTTGVDNNSGIGFPDWEQIASGFGLKYIKVQNNSQLDKNLIEKFSNRHPYVIDLNMTIDQPQIPRAVPLSSKATGFAQSNIENPYPFLPNQKVTDELTFLRNNNI